MESNKPLPMPIHDTRVEQTTVQPQPQLCAVNFFVPSDLSFYCIPRSDGQNKIKQTKTKEPYLLFSKFMSVFQC